MTVGDVDSTERGSGARFNDGKVPLDMIPLMALEDCAKVFGYGAAKYARNNWLKGMDWSVPLGCLLRHIAAWQRGEDTDPESGLPHLGHAMCNLVMLSTFAQTFPEGDDRAKEWLTSSGIAILADSTGRFVGDIAKHDETHGSSNPALDPDVADLMPENAPQSAFVE